ncbi:MAG: RNA-binding cell elongation regulator Jag/EloR [Pseudomonadota bacterium]
MSDGLFEGKTVEEATESACRELGLPRERLDIEVLSTGSSGVFGLGVKRAKIRVAVREEKPEQPSGELADAEKILRDMIELLGLDLTIETSREDEAVVFDLRGKDAGLLIGKQGQTLDALQYLLNKMLNKTADERIQVLLNCEGYREKRQAFLTDMALRLKEKVEKTGKPCYTELLNAADRRMIHIALQNESLVRTRSVGNGFLKKVIIYVKSQEAGGNRSEDERGKV